MSEIFHQLNTADMKFWTHFLLLCFSTFLARLAYAQPDTKPVYVFVHGTWGGGWAWKEVDSLLTADGSVVYRPTLTGQGERVHLASDDVGLQTHILDIVNTILYEDLHDIILVGHSYGGMVIAGVADSVPDRIKKLIYLDALVPENGESLNTIFKNNISKFEIVNGYIIPFWVPEGKSPPKDVPQPIHTWTDPIILDNPKRLNVPTFYILTVEKSKDPNLDDFDSQAQRARDNGWPVLQLESDHNAQWSAPGELVKLLKAIK
jgi:pimeloyl-ACP methyl ester carboxylesterase